MLDAYLTAVLFTFSPLPLCKGTLFNMNLFRNIVILTLLTGSSAHAVEHVLNSTLLEQGHLRQRNMQPGPPDDLPLPDLPLPDLPDSVSWDDERRLPWDHRVPPPPNIKFQQGKGGRMVDGVRCATRGKPRLFSRRELEDAKKKFAGRKLADTNINVVFHVIHNNGRQGDVTNLLDAQIVELNTAFAGKGFQFTKSQVILHNSRKYYTGCYNHDSRMKSEFAVDPAHNLNFYTGSPSGNLLGWAYFPDAAPEDHPIHGVVCLDQSLPGGTASPYNEGDTATHEVGHYLGLYHTFQGGCNAPGDHVDDTNFESSPTSGCPASKVSCGSPDPTDNFMDYSYDSCMDKFTADQATRMNSMVATYRPSVSNTGTSLKLLF